MAKFKVGDRVEIKNNYYESDGMTFRKGEPLVVIEIIAKGEHYIVQATNGSSRQVFGNLVISSEKLPSNSVSAEHKIEVKIHETKHLLTYEEACQLHKALEDSGV